MHKTDSSTNQVRLQENVVNTTLLLTQAKQHMENISGLADHAEVLVDMLFEQIDSITAPDMQRALLRVNALATGVQRSLLLIQQAGEAVDARLAQISEVTA